MFFKFIVISCLYIKYLDAVLNSFNNLHKLPLLNNYLAIKSGFNPIKFEPSRPNTHVINKCVYDRDCYNKYLLSYLAHKHESRNQLFETHTQLLKGSQNLNQLNILITHFINDLLGQYTLFFFELLGSLYLIDELKQHLPLFLESFQRKLIQLFKISLVSIIDASPKSRILILLNSIKFRIMVEKMAQMCKIFGFNYEFEKLENVLSSLNDERLSKIATWSVVHSEAFKKGLVMLSRTFVIATLNNFLIPLFFNFVLQVIPPDFPGYQIIQSILKCFNVTVK